MFHSQPECPAPESRVEYLRAADSSGGLLSHSDSAPRTACVTGNPATERGPISQRMNLSSPPSMAAPPTILYPYAPFIRQHECHSFRR